MSYPKANLGAIVLPTTDSSTPITWEEYKEKYGIDLGDIFEINSQNVVVFNAVTKPVYFINEIYGIPEAQFLMPMCGIALAGDNDDDVIIFALVHNVDGSINGKIGLYVAHDKKVYAYADYE